ncbi:MAG: 2-amino-4-hydroxy-6-hydroxymethyldihydropteridine diphosphokinase [Alphaproteobacteria bacterium]
MILIALGSNLESDTLGKPRQICEAALHELAKSGVAVVRVSRWYTSAPVPPSGQPWFVNGVAAVETSLSPRALLEVLHRIEDGMGRVRRVRNEARVIDLDLLAYDERVSAPGEWPELPHPRLATRAFVLLPLADVAPGWRHPVTGKSVRDLIAALPGDQVARPLDQGSSRS